VIGIKSDGIAGANGAISISIYTEGDVCPCESVEHIGGSEAGTGRLTNSNGAPIFNKHDEHFKAALIIIVDHVASPPRYGVDAGVTMRVAGGLDAAPTVTTSGWGPAGVEALGQYLSFLSRRQPD
jgi:hypothetical protein